MTKRKLGNVSVEANAAAEVKGREITRRWSQRRLDPESFEEGRDPQYKDWKSDEQYRRLKQTTARLQKEEKDNYPKIIDALKEEIQWLVQYLESSKNSFEELRNFYQKQLEVYRLKFNENSERIKAIEEQISKLTNEVNHNTERLNTLIRELNEEKARINQLAAESCNKVIEGYNKAVKEKICSKFCYYKLCGLENIISKFHEPKLTADALYALAIDALSCLAEIESQSQLEWNKFQPQYNDIKASILEFIEILDKNKQVKLNDETDILIDTDFWTDGRYDKLLSATQQLNQRVTSGEYARNYTLSDITLDQELLNKWRKKVDELIEKAKKRAYRAFYRKNLGINASDCLKNYGFSILVCQFEESNEKLSFIVEAERYVDERKISLIFTPEGCDEEAQFFFRHNQYMDPNDRAKFIKEIKSSLEDNYGVTCKTDSTSVKTILRYEESVLTPDGKLNGTRKNNITNIIK